MLPPPCSSKHSLKTTTQQPFLPPAASDLSRTQISHHVCLLLKAFGSPGTQVGQKLQGAARGQSGCLIPGSRYSCARSRARPLAKVLLVASHQPLGAALCGLGDRSHERLFEDPSVGLAPLYLRPAWGQITPSKYTMHFNQSNFCFCFSLFAYIPFFHPSTWQTPIHPSRPRVKQILPVISLPVS